MRLLRTAGAFGRTATSACFHTSTQAQTWRHMRVHSKRRSAEPQVPPSWRPFEVPEVLLDLDSWDSEHTRPYDNVERSVQQQKWGDIPRIDATWKRIRNFEYDRQRVSGNFAKVVSGDQWHEYWAVTDLDIMTTALRGAPQRRRRPEKKRPAGSDADGLLTSVAFENAIPMSTFQDEKSLLSWLLHRKSNTMPRPAKNLPTIQKFIRKQENLKNLRRYVLFLLQQGEDGLRLVHQCNDDIAHVLFQIYSSPENNSPTLFSFLPFFNSLFARYQRNGLSLGSELCSACLIMSVQAFQLQATRRFLEHGLREGYWVGNSNVRVALAALQRRWDKEMEDYAYFQADETYQAPGNRSNLKSPRETLTRLLAGDFENDGNASFKAVVEINPKDEKLQRLFSQLVAASQFIKAGLDERRPVTPANT